MNEPKISVIVPVYNADNEKYLKKCLNSLRFQTYSNLEIICAVNRSISIGRQILEEYTRLDSRIKIISEVNTNMYSALNNGISSANGEYISFINSEDWVLLTLYQTFADTINKLNQAVDIYMFNTAGYAEHQNDVVPRLSFGIEDWNRHKSDLTIHTFKDCRKPFTRNLGITNKIYLRRFLTDKNLFYPEFKYADETFCLQGFLRASSIVVNKNVLYRNRDTEKRITSSDKCCPEVFDIFRAVDHIETEIIYSGLYEAYKYAFFRYKYNAYFSRYRYCPENLRESYFNEMKYRLLSVVTDDLDKQITSKLENYGLYVNIKKYSRKEFDKLYKTYQFHK